MVEKIEIRALSLRSFPEFFEEETGEMLTKRALDNQIAYLEHNDPALAKLFLWFKKELEEKYGLWEDEEGEYVFPWELKIKIPLYPSLIPTSASFRKLHMLNEVLKYEEELSLVPLVFISSFPRIFHKYQLLSLPKFLVERVLGEGSLEIELGEAVEVLQWLTELWEEICKEAGRHLLLERKRNGELKFAWEEHLICFTDERERPTTKEDLESLRKMYTFLKIFEEKNVEVNISSLRGNFILWVPSPPSILFPHFLLSKGKKATEILEDILCGAGAGI